MTTMTTRFIALATAVAALAAPALAGEAGKAISREEAQAFLAPGLEARSKMKTLAARITNTKESVILLEKTVSLGYLRVKKPDSFRRDIVKPSRSAVMLAGNTGHFCLKGKKARAFDLSKSRGASASGAIFKLLVSDGFDLGDLEKRFAVKATMKGADMVLELTPKDEQLAEQVSVLAITFAKGAVWPKSVMWETADGDIVSDEFSGVVVDGPVRDSTFKPPVNWKEDIPVEATKGKGN